MVKVKLFLKVRALVIGVGILMLIGMAMGQTSSNPTSGGWPYRQSITIPDSGSNLTNYQTLVTLDTVSLISNRKMRTDCTDIRFIDFDSSTQLSYWLESGCNTTSTRLWVKVPSVPSADKTIYIYYGNFDAASASNGNNVFDFFDDFSSNTIGTKWQINTGVLSDKQTSNAYIDTTKGWAVIDSVGWHSFVTKSVPFSRPFIAEMKWLLSDPFLGQEYTAAIQYYDPGVTLDFNLNSYHAFSKSNGAWIRYGGTNSFTDYGPSPEATISANNWYLQRLTLTDSEIRSSVLNPDGTEISFATLTDSEWNNRKLGIDNFNDGTAGKLLNVDYIYVRKYVLTEPVTTVGAEEIIKRAGDSIYLGEGYALLITKVDSAGNKIWTELQLNGSSIDSKILNKSESDGFENTSFFINIVDIYHNTNGDYVIFEIFPPLNAYFDLIVSSIPQEANILIDGEYKGKTPKTIPIYDFETHSLRLVLSEYKDEERAFKFEQNEGKKEILITLNSTSTPAPFTSSPTTPAPALTPTSLTPSPTTPAPALTPTSLTPSPTIPAPAPTPTATDVPGFLAISFILAILCGYLILKKWHG